MKKYKPKCIDNLKSYITFVPVTYKYQKMKKILAFAFVAGMVSFAACTSKPSEESAVDSSAIEAAVDTVAIDTVAADSVVVDSVAH